MCEQSQQQSYQADPLQSLFFSSYANQIKSCVFHPALIVIHKIILQSLWPFPCHPHCIDINQIMNDYKASASLIFFLQSTPWENESNSLRMGNILCVIGSPMIASNKTQLQFSIQTTKLTQTNILIHHAIYANTLLHDHILDGYFY